MRADSGGVQPAATARSIAPAAPSATRSTIVFATNARYITSTLYSVNADGTGLRRLFSWKTLFRIGRWAFQPALSPNGRQVAFRVGYEPGTAIELANLDGSGVHLLNGGENPTWSPDGTHIAYSTTHGQGIYAERPDGTDWRLVTLHGKFPAWSPDGTKFAYICGPATHTALCVMNTDGAGQDRIAAVAVRATPAWSPDGTKIAFLNSPPLPNGGLDMHVYVINANGTHLRRLAPRINYQYYGCGPTWSPNGKQIAFSRLSPFYPNNDARRGGVYLMDPTDETSCTSKAQPASPAASAGDAPTNQSRDPACPSPPRPARRLPLSLTRSRRSARKR